MPDAEETISYGIPTFTLAGRSVVHVAAWKRHVSLYPVPAGGRRASSGELAPYRSGPGRYASPWAVPLPLELIVPDRGAAGRTARRSADPAHRGRGGLTTTSSTKEDR